MKLLNEAYHKPIFNGQWSSMVVLNKYSSFTTNWNQISYIWINIGKKLINSVIYTMFYKSMADSKVYFYFSIVFRLQTKYIYIPGVHNFSSLQRIISYHKLKNVNSGGRWAETKKVKGRLLAANIFYRIAYILSVLLPKIILSSSITKRKQLTICFNFQMKAYSLKVVIPLCETGKSYRNYPT